MNTIRLNNPGFDVRSVDNNGTVWFIEVKGRIEGSDTVTVTRNEMLTGLNKPDHFILALVEVRLDGTDKRTVAIIQAETYEAGPSPDGRGLAFAVREDIFVAAIPLSAEPPTIGESRGPGPVKRITREGGIDLHWEDGSETLAWTFADTFYRIDVSDAVALRIR